MSEFTLERVCDQLEKNTNALKDINKTLKDLAETSKFSSFHLRKMVNGKSKTYKSNK